MAQTPHLLLRRWFVSLAALLLLLLSVEPSSSHPETRNLSDGTEPISVGMVALLAAPEKYEGKLVRTIGFMCIEFEGDALYLHGEDYRYGLTKNSFSLRLTDSQRKQFKSISLKYVLIEGTLYANGPERTNLWSGAIGNIKRLEPTVVDRGSVPRQ